MVFQEQEKQVFLASGFLILFGSLLVIAPTVLTSPNDVFRKGMMKGFMLYSGARSKYRWRHRVKTPDFLRPMGDFFFKVSTQIASVNSPRNTSESVKVLTATFKRADVSIDVGDKVDALRKLMDDTGKITICMEDLVSCTSGLDDWSLEVIYIGHADPTKRIAAAEFGVKYVAKALDSIVFPPYNAKEKIKKGFGNRRILHARTFHEKDLTPLAKKYAGLKTNFYEDLKGDLNGTQVQKFHIDHSEVHVLLSAKGNEKATVIVNRK